MTNVRVVEMAVCAASPPKKAEGIQTPKGEDSFNKFLEACNQSENKEEVTDVPKDEANKAESAKVEVAKEEAARNLAEAAALMLQIAPVQVQTHPAEAAPVEALEIDPEPSKSAALAILPVEEEAATDVKAEAKGETAPTQTETAAPVKAGNKVEVSTFTDALKAVDVDKSVEVLAPVPPKVETSQVAPIKVQAAVTEVAAEAKAVVKVETIETVETAPATTASENVSGKVSIDLTTTMAEARPAQLAQHLRAEIAMAAASGKNSLHIQIQPENMGRIDVRLFSNSDGMQVVLTTDSASTGKLLEDNLSQLQKSLANAGLQISGLSVNSQGLQGQSSNSYQDQKSVLSHFYPNRTTVAAMPVEAIASRYSNQISGLDFRI